MYKYFILVIKKDLSVFRMWVDNSVVIKLMSSDKVIYRGETTQIARMDGDTLVWEDVKEVSELEQ